MTRRHQLETTLRTLKLSGMLDTLEARLAQATAGELGHLEFLQALCEDEIARRIRPGATRDQMPLVAVIDEFGYLARAEPELPSLIQRALGPRARRRRD